MKEEKPAASSAIARADFDAALNKGFWRSIFAWFTQQNNELLPFDEVRRALPIHSQHYIGMREIPLQQIIGSVGRYNDFDRVFLPRRRALRERWANIDRAHMQEIQLPPIEVYKLGSVYFVLDGNHRVSVARERGQEFIDAMVIEMDVPFEVDENTDIDRLIMKSEKATYLANSQIRHLVPEADIEFSLPGGYSKIDEHIRVHTYFMGQEQQRDVPLEEGTRDWFEQVYLPLIRVIRNYKILERFPGRSESDLYLWIIDHLWYLRKEYGQEISMEQAAADFSEKYARHPWRAFLRIFKRAWNRIRYGHPTTKPKKPAGSSREGPDPHP
jgi:uncharacterized ParB-like nuclease family protein